jgi:ribonucleoside-triphosphate reductase (thioredoxin)
MDSITVIKRDKTLQPWSLDKVETAITKSFQEFPKMEGENHKELALRVQKEIARICKDDKKIDIERVQDAVESTLMTNHPEAAKAYIKYRAERERLRTSRKDPDPSAISDYIHAAKYAASGGTELFPDTIKRNLDMHLKKFESVLKDNPELKNDIIKAHDLVIEKKIRQSSRAMQFAGRPIEKSNMRLYNCTATHVNRLRAFGEIMYALLCGAGVGYSVQFHHVEQLTEVKHINKSDVLHFTIEDSIEGWSDAVNELIRSYFLEGNYVEFSYNEVRKEGSPLSTGGLAPGHIPLKVCLENIRRLLHQAQGRKLRPIEVYDIVCFIAEAVLSGGIRRSATICVFSANDSEMMYAKAHGNFRPATAYDPGVNSQRQMSNNSAMLVRSNTDRETFDRLMKLSKEWGEPGFIFAEDHDFMFNPCGEASLYPMLGSYTNIKKKTRPEPDRSMDYDYKSYTLNADEMTDSEAIKLYGSRTGFQSCNLTEVNVAIAENPEDFIDYCKAAALIGTLQAAYTDFPYLGPVSERIIRKEALLGVGLTGIMDNPDIGLNPAILKQGAKAIVKENERVAKILGINPTARATVVKPSGTASLALDNVSSGIHYHHARRYFRRVTANPNEMVAKHFLKYNSHMVEKKPNGDFAIVFPTKAPDGAKTVKEENAMDFISHVLTVYENWVVPGSLTKRNKLPLSHNVSATVAVRDEEWEEVIETVWDHRDTITAMSFLPLMGDKKYPFAPREEVMTEADEAKWNYLIEHYKPVDYSTMEVVERNLGLEAACAGGACEI